MPKNIPVVPVALGALAGVLIAATAAVARRFKALVRARRNRRDANVLAGLDQHMLRDIGISRSDLNDAISSPFWEDPTELLCNRLEERRANRARNIAVLTWRGRELNRAQGGYTRPRTDRPARQAM